MGFVFVFTFFLSFFLFFPNMNWYTTSRGRISAFVIIHSLLAKLSRTGKNLLYRKSILEAFIHP